MSFLFKSKKNDVAQKNKRKKQKFANIINPFHLSGLEVAELAEIDMPSINYV